MNNKKYLVTEDIVATIPQRFLNYLIDTIMQLIFLIGIAIIALVIYDAMGSKKAIHFIATLNNNTIGLYTISYAMVVLYYNIFEIIFAQSIGKFVTQTIVVDEHGEKPHYETILIRSLCRIIPFNPFSVLILGRGWHDSLSKTYVVDKKRLEEEKRKYYRLCSN